jgi:hypothetical protein
MKSRVWMTVGLAGAAALAPAAAHAQEAADKLSFRFEGKAGAEYNSNVAVLDLDTNTGEGDWAATVAALAEVSYMPVKGLTLRAGYDGSQSLYQELDQFNLGIHRGYGEAAYDFSFATVGVLGNYAEAYLDGDSYLTFSQVSPYVSRQFGEALFLRAAYARTDKEFDGRPDRDASSDAGQIDAYIFLDGVNRYVVLGGKVTDEDANTDALDYTAGSGKARFVQKFEALGVQPTFRIGAEYEDRDYADPGPGPLAGPARSDQRLTADAALEIPFTKNVFTEVSYRYGDYTSTLAAADYSEHVAGVRLGLRY